jgi:hypothetical protein
MNNNTRIVFWTLAALISPLTICAAPLCATAAWQIVQQDGGELLEVRAPKGGHHTLEIDDAFGFRRPVLKKDFSGSNLQIHALELGLIPGIDYHARLDGQPDVKDFRIVLSTFVEPEVSCDNLRRTWQESARKMVGNSASRVGWDADRQDWVQLDSQILIGSHLYFVEHWLRPTLNAARACHDLETLDEIAKYYPVVMHYSETLGTLLSRPNVFWSTGQRMAAADRSARTFPADIDGKVADGELYNSQWLHPAAEFLRMISLLPPERRTPAMQNFASQYMKFIVVDQLDRYLVQQRIPLPGGGAGGRIELWKRDLAGLKGETPSANWLTDIDLWLMASAAEVLGANANDPALAPLTAPQAEMLHRAIETGSRFVESRRHVYSDTENFRREKVGSVAYAIGDFAEDSSFAYSGVTSEKFPTPAEKRPLADVGWDISHSYRFPVFMRALYENRKATGVDWPSYHEVQFLANQYAYRVFNGDFSRPLFHTHLDGSDGWYRVGHNGGTFGYPPSRYCDQHDPNRPCMTTAAIQGWGRIAFANPDLIEIEHALVKLALDPNPQAQEFRYRYYFDDTPFEVLGPPGKQIYALPLFFVIGDNAERIASH